MLELRLEQRSVDATGEYLERVKLRIFAKMQEGMQEAMEGLAAEAVSQAEAAGIHSRSGQLFESILDSPRVKDAPEFVRGTVSAEKGAKHVGLWMEEGYSVPAVKLSDSGQRRRFNRSPRAGFLHRAFKFTASDGAVVWAAGHKAFTVAPHPFMNRAIQAFKAPIMDIIRERVAEAYR